MKQVCYTRLCSRLLFPQSAAFGVECSGGVCVLDALRVSGAIVEEVEAAATSMGIRGAVVRSPTGSKLLWALLVGDAGMHLSSSEASHVELTLFWVSRESRNGQADGNDCSSSVSLIQRERL